MRGWVKALLWIGLGGTIGFGGGYLWEKHRDEKERKEMCESCDFNCQSCEYKQMVEEVTADMKKEADAMAAQAEYAGGNAIDYSRNPDGELVQAAADDAIDIPEDLEVLEEEAPNVEYISEDEYYSGAGGMTQEELLFYTEDEVVWNKDTQSVMKDGEILRALRCENGQQVHTMYFWPDAAGDISETRFIRNHLIPAEFRMDRVDAAWHEEQDTGEHDDD